MGYKIDAEESRRLDALKVLMCIFVLLIHAFSDDYMDLGWQGLGGAYRITFVISRIVSDCAVPVFILISSILLYAKPIHFFPNLKKKCRSLLLPYLIFNTLWILLMFVKHVLGQKLGIQAGDDIDFSTYSWFDWLDAYLGLTPFYKPILSTLWYVRDLFLLNLLAIPIRKLVDLLPIPTLIATLVLWFSGVYIPGIQSYSLPFFVLGCFVVKYDLHLPQMDKKIPLWVIFLTYIGGLIAVVLTNRDILWVMRLFLLVSVVFWFRFSGSLTRFPKIIDLILPATFFLYLSHRFVYEVIQILADGSVKIYLLTYILKPLSALVILLSVYYLMRRFLPGVLSLMVGGRVRRKGAS